MNFQKKYSFFSVLVFFVSYGLTLNAQTLYWLDAAFSSPVIGKSDADGSNIQTTALTSSSLPEVLTYSYTNSKIVWTELKFSGAGIQSTDTSFTTPSQLLSNASVIRGIAVDIDSNWIYYATSNLQVKPKIHRIHPDGTGNETILVLDSITGNPRALSIDAVARHLYWTEFTQGTIKRINLDGVTTPQTIVSGLNGPVGLAVDGTGGKLYWAEANANTISQSLLNGFAKVVILSSLATPNYLTIDTTGGFVYWTEIGIPRIRKATVTGASIETLPITVSHPTGIRFVSQNEAALPVELTTFTVSATNDAATLTWKTATEVNNYGFEIERRADGGLHLAGGVHLAWGTIGFVEGNGTTNAPKEYSFSDKNLSAGKYSYRLKQIDRDGKFEYSQHVEVSVTPKVFALEQNYPNPFNPSTQIRFAVPVSGFVSLKVFDILGKEMALLVNEVKEAGEYKAEFTARNTPSGMSAKGGYASGIYFYTLRAGNFFETKKMLMIK